MENDRIERQYQDSKDLVAYLMEKSEVSFATYIDSVYKKCWFYRLQVILKVSFQKIYQLMRQKLAALISE